MNCSFCGAELEAGSGSCKKCGGLVLSNLDNVSVTQSDDLAKMGKSKKIAGLVFGILSLVCGIAAFICAAITIWLCVGAWSAGLFAVFLLPFIILGIVLGLVLAVLSMILAFIGIVLSASAKRKNGFAIAGIILSLLPMAIPFFIIVGILCLFVVIFVTSRI